MNTYFLNCGSAIDLLKSLKSEEPFFKLNIMDIKELDGH